MEKTERDRERKKLLEPQKHDFYMDEKTPRETYPNDEMKRSKIDRAEMLLRLKQMEHQFLEKLNEMTADKMEMKNQSDSSSSSTSLDETQQHRLEQLENLSREIEMKE